MFRILVPAFTVIKFYSEIGDSLNKYVAVWQYLSI